MEAGIAEPPGDPIAPTKLPSRSSRIAGVIDERGRLPPAISFAAGTGPLAGLQEKSVCWWLRKKPSPMRPDPKHDSIVVVIDTALPRAYTMPMWTVPPGSFVWYYAGGGASCGWEAASRSAACGGKE